MWGWYRANKRAVSSKHGSRWCGAGIMWMRECPLHMADRCGGAGIMWIREQCLTSTAAADEGLVSCEWVRSQVIVLCTRQNAALRRGAACLDSGPCGICGDIGTLSSGICTRLSAPPWKGGREKPGWCPVLQVRWVRGMRTFIRHELITRVQVHRWSRTDGLILRKTSYSPERCRGAAIQRPPSDERTSTVSCNSL